MSFNLRNLGVPITKPLNSGKVVAQFSDESSAFTFLPAAKPSGLVEVSFDPQVQEMIKYYKSWGLVDYLAIKNRLKEEMSQDRLPVIWLRAILSQISALQAWLNVIWLRAVETKFNISQQGTRTYKYLIYGQYPEGQTISQFYGVPYKPYWVQGCWPKLGPIFFPPTLTLAGRLKYMVVKLCPFPFQFIIDLFM